jgi:hypothetical protein
LRKPFSLQLMLLSRSNPLTKKSRRVLKMVFEKQKLCNNQFSLSGIISKLIVCLLIACLGMLDIGCNTGYSQNHSTSVIIYSDIPSGYRVGYQNMGGQVVSCDKDGHGAWLFQNATVLQTYTGYIKFKSCTNNVIEFSGSYAVQ